MTIQSQTISQSAVDLSLDSGKYIIGDASNKGTAVAFSGDVTSGADGTLTIGNGKVSGAKMAALTSANILVGNASNVATGVAVTGDITISNAGVTAIGATKVTNAMLADDAVGLAEMAAGTAGNLITYDASGNPAAVATGTATQVLTSNGAGAAPTFQAAAGGSSLVVLSSGTQAVTTSGATINTNVTAAQLDANATIFAEVFLIDDGGGTPHTLTISASINDVTSPVTFTGDAIASATKTGRMSFTIKQDGADISAAIGDRHRAISGTAWDGGITSGDTAEDNWITTAFTIAINCTLDAGTAQTVRYHVYAIKGS